MHRRRNVRFHAMTLGVAIVAAAAASPAGAVHWPNFGGDAGRSGYQPVDEVAPPVVQVHKTLGAEIKTSPITTTGGGNEAQALIAFGTLDHLHHRLLLTGAPHGQADVDDGVADPDTFGDPLTRASVTPVESSTATSAGITFAVHNDDDQDGAVQSPVTSESDRRTGADIAIALVGQASGSAFADQAVGPMRPSTAADRAEANTIGFTIKSSPVISGAAPDGSRSIYFVATRSEDTVSPQTFPCSPGADFEAPPAQQGNESTRGCFIPAATRLFKVVVAAANTMSASFTDASVFAVDVPSANGEASPALLNIGTETHVAVGTTDGFVRTYRASDLAPGPVSADLGHAVFTPSVPVRSDGFVPAPATDLFVAALRAETDPDSSRVHRLTAAAEGLAVADQSPNLAGVPAPALAVTSEHDSIVPGRVLFTTSKNLFSLNTANLGEGTQLDLTSALSPGTSGFSRTTAAASGGLAFVTNDRGDQLVLDAVSLERVAESAFTPHSGGTPAANEGIGQPSVSRRFVQFTTADGLFVYRGSIPPVPGAESTFFSIDDVSVREGDAGTSSASFTVRKTGAAAASVDVATADGTAAAATDYVARAQTLTFGPGEGTLTFDVTINADVADEPDEIFKVLLSGATGGTSIADPEGTGLITDDDSAPQPEPPPVLLVSDAVVFEGVDAAFTVSLTRPATGPVTAAYATRDDSARAGADYAARAGTLRFEPGETSKTVVVPTQTDPDDEQTERFALEIAQPSGATPGDASGIGTIIDGDVPAVVAAVDPRGITVTVRPKRDARAPYRFTTTGRLLLPAGISSADGCAGRVSVQVKAGRKTISTRRAPVGSDCRYRVRVTFANRRRFTRNGVLKFTVRYLGTPRVRKFTARPKLVRAR